MIISPQQPLVTVYIATHNRIWRLQRALSSVFKQDFTDYEIIVCDDASSDGTREYMEALINREPKIRYLRNEIRQGACVTRNLGIFAARGKYITGLDDDDAFEANRLSYFLANWKDDYAFLCTNFRDTDLQNWNQDHYPSTTSLKRMSYADILFENKASNQVFTLTENLRAVGGFSPKVLRLQDWDTWLRLAYKFGKFVRLPMVTYTMYHDHGPHETRVSESQKFIDSLRDLLERNSHLYSEHQRRHMEFLIANMRGKSSFNESCYWTLQALTSRYIKNYFLNFPRRVD